MDKRNNIDNKVNLLWVFFYECVYMYVLLYIIKKINLKKILIIYLKKNSFKIYY